MEPFLKYINCLIPLIIGVLVLFLPQLFTKKDLAADENAALCKRFKLVGFLLIAAALILAIGQAI